MYKTKLKTIKTRFTILSALYAACGYGATGPSQSANFFEVTFDGNTQQFTVSGCTVDAQELRNKLCAATSRSCVFLGFACAFGTLASAGCYTGV